MFGRFRKSQRNRSTYLAKGLNRSRLAGLEMLEDRRMLAVDIVDFTGATDSWISVLPAQVDTAIAGDVGAKLGAKLPGLDQSIDELNDLQAQLEAVGVDLREAETIYRNDNATYPVESLQGFIAALSTITNPSNSSGYDGIHFVGGSFVNVGTDHVQFTLNFEHTSNEQDIALDSALGGLGFDVGLTGIAPEFKYQDTLDISIIVDINNNFSDDRQFGFVAEDGSDATTFEYRPEITSADAVEASGEIAGVLKFNADLSASFGPTINFDTGNSSTVTALANLATELDFLGITAPKFEFLFAGTIDADGEVFPELGYEAKFSLDIGTGTLTGPTDQVLFIGNERSDASDTTQLKLALLKEVIGSSGSELLDQAANLIDPDIAEILLGETEIIGDITVAYLMDKVSAGEFPTPVDLLKLVGPAGDILAFSVKTILQLAAAADDATDEVNNASAPSDLENYLNRMKDQGLIFPILDQETTVYEDVSLSLTHTVMQLEKIFQGDDGVDLVLFEMNLLNHPYIQQIQSQDPTFIQSLKDAKDEPGAVVWIDEDLETPAGDMVDHLVLKLEVESVKGLIRDALEDALGSFASNEVMQRAIDLFLGFGLDALDAGWDLEAKFAAQFKAGMDTHFLGGGGVEDSFYIDTGTLLNFDVDLDFFAELDEGETPFGNFPPIPTVGDIKDAGKDFDENVTQPILNGGKEGLDTVFGGGDGGLLLTDFATQLFQKFVYGKISVVTDGALTIGIRDLGNVDTDKLRLSEIDLGNPLRHICLDGHLNADLDAVVNISTPFGDVDLGDLPDFLQPFSKPFNPDPISLIPSGFFESLTCINQGGANHGGGGGAVGMKVFSDVQGNILNIYGTENNDTIILGFDSDTNEIIIFHSLGIKRWDRDDYDIDIVTVDLRGIVTPADPPNTIGPEDGGIDYVVIGAALPADLDVDVYGSNDGNTVRGHDGFGNFFGGSLDIVGGNSSDILIGGGGPTQIWGGPGVDLLQAGRGTSDLYGGDDTDYLFGLDASAGPPTFAGGKFVGGEGSDAIIVGSVSRGNFILIGGEINSTDDAGGNFIVGGYGNDQIFAGNVTNGSGYTADLSSGLSSILIGGPGNDKIFGSPFTDITVGGWLGINSEANIAYSGRDEITAGDGDDILVASNGVVLPNPTRLVATEVDQHLGAGLTEILNGGGGNDLFVLGPNDSTVMANGGSEDDFFMISSDAGLSSGTVDNINGDIHINAGSGLFNRIFINDSGGTGNGDVEVTNNSIKGIAPGDIFYQTSGTFLNPTILEPNGIHIVGSKTDGDTFTVKSTLSGSTTLVDTLGGMDLVNVGSSEADDNGDLDEIAGLLTIFGGDSSGDKVYINDRGGNNGTEEFHYDINGTSVFDGANPDASARTFAGVLHASVEHVQVDGTDGVNKFSVKPSPDVEFFIDGNDPPPDTFCGDFLEIYFPGTTGRKLNFTDRDQGEGFWEFAAHQNVGFTNIEYFNYFELLAIGAEAEPTSSPNVRIYDAETKEFQIEITAYRPDYVYGVRVDLGDVTGDGIPDIITAPGVNHSPQVRMFDLLTGGKLKDFWFRSYARDLDVGINFAVADINNDKLADIVVGPARGREKIKVLENQLLTDPSRPFSRPVATFRAFAEGNTFTMVDTNGDDFGEILVAPGTGTQARVKVFDVYSSPKPVKLLAFDALNTSENSRGGISLDAGIIDGVSTLIVGDGRRGLGRVQVIDASNGNVIDEFVAYPEPLENAGLSVALKDADNDGDLDTIFTGQRTDGTTDEIRKFDLNGNLVDFILENDPDFIGGYFLG